jgi:hypothetical protein
MPGILITFTDASSVPVILNLIVKISIIKSTVHSS